MAAAHCADITSNDIMATIDDEEKSVGGETGVFDETMGILQTILLEEGFCEVQQAFFEKHFHHFNDSDENKFIYTDIFKQYSELVEGYLERELQSRMPDFNMHTFLESLETHRDEIVDDIFDLLLSCSDFITFKQTILSYKTSKEGAGLDLGALTVTPLSLFVEVYS